MEIKKGSLNSLFIIILLLVSALGVILSGLVLQQGFHRIDKIDLAEHVVNLYKVHFQPIQYEQLRGIYTGKTEYGLDYHAWSVLHRSVVVFFSLLIIYHVYAHRKWYRQVIGKHLVSKNIYLIILSALFSSVAFTGFISWFIDLSSSRVMVRMIFIEIHDKIALILPILLIPHITKRIRWFASFH